MDAYVCGVCAAGMSVCPGHLEPEGTLLPGSRRMGKNLVGGGRGD